VLAIIVSINKGESMDREIILAILVIITAPVSFAIGYYYRGKDAK
jgi:hypothetical protein